MIRSAPIESLARRLGVDLFVGDPATTAEPIGLVGASPNAQACQRGVCVTSLTPYCAYSICHELAHIVVGFPVLDENEVFRVQNVLASMLDETWRSKALVVIRRTKEPT